MRICKETIADNSATELEARQGGITPTSINPQLLYDIQVQLNRLIEKADQLIENVTTNLAECWMHIRTKFDGGKVINRCQSGSWEHRCMGAGLQQNSGRVWGPQIWRHMTKSSPNKVFVNTAERSAERVLKDRKRKETDKAKEQRRKSKYSKLDNTSIARQAYSRHDGSILAPEQVSNDIPPEDLEELKSMFYETKVVITRDEN